PCRSPPRSSLCRAWCCALRPLYSVAGEEHVMLSAAGQAFRDMFTPSFRAVLFKCVGFTIALLALLIVGIEWTFSYFVQWPDWIETSIEWLGGLALVVGSLFLIPPGTSPVAGVCV